MLLIKIDGTLSCLVTDGVAMGKVLSNDTAARFLFLSDLVTLTLGSFIVVASIIVSGSRSTGNLDLAGTELGVV